MNTFEFEHVVNQHAEICKRNRRAARYVRRVEDRRSASISIIKMVIIVVLMLAIIILATLKVADFINRQPKPIEAPQGHTVVYEEYCISRGDTLTNIADAHGQEEYFRNCDLIAAIAETNNIPSPDHIRTGDVILIPQIR